MQLRAVLFFTALSASSGISCAVDLQVGTLAAITCHGVGQCPDGMSCVRSGSDDSGMCRRPGAACTTTVAGELVAEPDSTPCLLDSAPQQLAVCVAAQCQRSGCGDGVFDDRVEECEPGAGGGEPCRGDCTVRRCGDGQLDVDLGEQCDDGIDNGPGASCSTECTFGCGDGHRQLGEQCDDGNAVSGDGCDTNCTPSGCGNGVLTGEELCDDGNALDGDGCDSTCRPTGCGSGVRTGTEACDDGNLVNSDGCDVNCTPSGCGNGVVNIYEGDDIDEECDDANATDGDGCDNNCSISRCGNGVVAGAEVCDDGNTVAQDGCSPDCRSLEVCGDGLLGYVRLSDGAGGFTYELEECDCGDGTGSPPAGCSGPNSDLPDATCRTDCSRGRCGDGIPDSLEECEPGRTHGVLCGDGGYYTGVAPGCDPQTCRLDWEPSCSGRCGDEQLNGDELCEVVDGGPDLYAVGADCLALGFDRGAPRCASRLCVTTSSGCGPIGWQTLNLGTGVFRAVAGSGPDDVYVAGNIEGFHYDGQRWSQVPGLSTAAALWVSATGDVIAGNALASVLRNGSLSYLTGSLGSLMNLHAVHGVDAGGGYTAVLFGTKAYASEQLVWVYDGTTAVESAAPTSNTVGAAWVFGATDYFAATAAGSGSAVWHHTGSGWSFERTLSADVSTMWGDESSGELFVLAKNGSFWRRGSGGAWSTLPNAPVVGTGWRMLLGVSPTELYTTIGGPDAIHRYDGATWRTVSDPGSGVDLYGAYAADANNLFLVGDGATVQQFRGYDWLETDAGVNGHLAAHASDAAILVGASLRSFADPDFVDRSLGLQIETANNLPAFNQNDGAAWMASASTAYLAGGSPVEVYAWDGTDVTAQNVLAGGFSKVTAIDGTGADDVYLLAEVSYTEGHLYHRGSGSWTQVEDAPPPASLYTYQAMTVAGTEVYLFGQESEVVSFDGTSWSTQPVPSGSNSQVIHGAASAFDAASGQYHIWAVSAGDGLYFDGAEWNRGAIGIALGLRAVCAMSPARAYGVSASGIVAEWIGDRWWPMRSPLVGTSLDQVICLPDVGSVVIGHQNGGVSALRVPPAK